MNQGPVHQTLRSLAERLESEGLAYALVGGMALYLHGYRRFTEDVYILLTPEGLASFQERLVGLGYVPAFPSARKTFRDAETRVKVEALTTGEFPGDGKPKPVSFPDPALARERQEGLWVESLRTIVELKLASGLSATHRARDLVDVQESVQHLHIPRELAASLDPLGAR
jgi:hypothetical protein